MYSSCALLCIMCSCPSNKCVGFSRFPFSRNRKIKFAYKCTILSTTIECFRFARCCSFFRLFFKKKEIWEIVEFLLGPFNNEKNAVNRFLFWPNKWKKKKKEWSNRAGWNSMAANERWWSNWIFSRQCARCAQTTIYSIGILMYSCCKKSMQNISQEMCFEAFIVLYTLNWLALFRFHIFFTWYKLEIQTSIDWFEMVSFVCDIFV